MLFDPTGVTLRRFEGNAIGCVRAEMEAGGLTMEDEQGRPAPDAGQQRVHLRLSLRGKFTLLLACWLLIMFGAVVVAINAGTTQETTPGRIRNLALGISVGLLGTASFAYILVRTVTRPISMLIAGTRSVAEGILDTRIDIHTNDELEVLATSFNQMTSNLRKMTESLQFSAIHDMLTGLPNRTLFTDRLKHVVDRNAGRAAPSSFGVMFLDLDRFKLINDSFGHSAGDQLLVDLGRRLGTCLRRGDTIARLGGDEFGVVLEDLEGTEQAITVARRIQRILETPFHLRGQEVFATMSIGIAVASQGDVDPETMLRNADIAMYRAKQMGRGNYMIFDDEMRGDVLRTLQMQTALRRGFDRKEFNLVYQPIVLLGTGEVVGFEALARWSSPHGSSVPAGEFIAHAEETGLILPIGDWVLGEACRQLRRWSAAHPSLTPLCMSVNISRRQLAQPDLGPRVLQILRELSLDPSQLMLEITEGAIMESAEDAARILATLRAHGIRIAMDDFGTGYSSLSLLQRFPLDVVKIDRSFVGELSAASADGSQVLRAIAGLAGSLGLDVIAEGVERREQVALLQGLHCAYGQGYYFSPPQDAVSLTVLLDGQHAGGLMLPLDGESIPPSGGPVSSVLEPLSPEL